MDLNVITCGYLHEKARTVAGVNIHIRYRFLRKRLDVSGRKKTRREVGLEGEWGRLSWACLKNIAAM